jgi:hypothetical protein
MSFQEIRLRIDTFMEKASENHKTFSHAEKRAAMLQQIGFTESPSSEFDPELKKYIERAKCSQVFGNKAIIFQEDIEYLCKKYKLEMHPSQMYTEIVPVDNIEDIQSFIDSQRLYQWNLGTNANNNWYVPINTPFFVIAPKELFNQKKIAEEKRRKELERIRQEDPIVVKRVYKFDPRTKENTLTDMYVVVTAWSVEAIYAEIEGLI